MFKLSNKIAEMFSSENGSNIYDRITATLKTENMTAQIEQGVLVGFSGGADSVLLLCYLAEYRRRYREDLPILAAHVNHGIRGNEALRDENFSKSFADALSIEFISCNINVPAISKETGLGLEEAARNARYSIFSGLIASRKDISTIAIAHNSTDNAETVLMNILRGSGISGVCGIKPVRDNIIRPLIKISKSEITQLLEDNDIPYVTDSTNLSTDYSRNYVRNEIFPLLHRLSSNPESAITKLTENLRSDLDYLNTQALKFLQAHSDNKITNRELLELHPSIQAKVISMLVHEKCSSYPEEKHITSLRVLLSSDNFRYSLPGDYDFVCERGICTFSPKSNENKLSGQIFSLSRGENKIVGTNLTVFIGEINKSSLNVYNFSIQAHIASDIIDDGLFLRFKSDGDAYKYCGMTHKLKKVFNDRNIPSSERELIPLVCDSHGIIVVPGMSERDGAKSDISNNNTPITFAYSTPRNYEVEVFTALLRK